MLSGESIDLVIMDTLDLDCGSCETFFESGDSIVVLDLLLSNECVMLGYKVCEGVLKN